MKVQKTILYVLVSIMIVVASFLLFVRFSNKLIPNTNLTKVQANIIEDKLDSLTLSEKVGQMFVVGFNGEQINDYIKTSIENNKISGVILMGQNIKGEDQTKALTLELQNLAKNTNLKLPLFIAVDQEGGVVTRIKFSSLLGQTAQVDIKSAEEAFLVAKTRAIELAKLGINVDFSPVLEIIDNPSSFMYNRVFRGGQANVLNFGVAMIQAYQANNVIASPKHFPGHENSSIDSHQNLPVVKMDALEFDNRLNFYNQVITQSEPKMIMVGHILYENIDANYPASLSNIIINQSLRQKLNYQGLVITDDMQMGALTNNYSNVDAVVKAVQAGNDLLLYVSQPNSAEDSIDKIEQARQAIVQAVSDGEISVEQINDSVRRILKAKQF